MDIKTGSKEELEAEERLERLRIASAERKWKMELRHKFIASRRDSYLAFFDKNDTLTLCICVGVGGVLAVCLIKIIWNLFH